MSTFFTFQHQGLQNSIVIRLICFNYRIKAVFLSSCFFMPIGYRLSVSYKRFVINKKNSFTDG